MNVNSGKIKVLYVDDEENNLNSFKALLRFDYEVFIAGSPAEAIQILRKNPKIEIIISDQRMPKKTGVEFFTELQEEFPMQVRMLLTAYTEVDDIIKAINKGHIFRYITKPWLEEELKSAIEEAYHYFLSTTALKIRNEELQEAYNDLDSFSYTVAHDIRGPILSIINALDFIKSSDDNEEVDKFLTVLGKTMNNLNEYIVNTHSYHRIQRGRIASDIIDFKELIDSILDVTAMQRKLLNIDFTVSITQNRPFISDKILLSLIIDNIVSNAFKFKAQKPAVHTVTLNVLVHNDHVLIEVEDNGIGIEKAAQDKIFELFYRGDQLVPGSGFGLYNVSRAVKKLNGSLTVDSELNVFTRFLVTIPESV